MERSNGLNGTVGRMRPAVMMAAFALLAACYAGPQAGRAPGSPTDLADGTPELDQTGEVVSPLIAELTQRRSVLPAGSAYAQVADAVLEAGRASAEAELRVKRLTARARSKNWLPSVGPDVSLTSLSSIAASLILDQAVFDNGRRKAERDFAAADVEVAAISLVSDLNQRVYDGLRLYVEAARARELAGISETALVRMRDFERIMTLRMQGGLADQSELRVISQKKAEMEASLTSERQGAESALAELAVLAGGPVKATGISNLPADPGRPEALSVLLARGEAARTGAEVRIARAGLRPGLGASASVARDGGLDGGLSMNGDVLGFGRADKLRALDEAEEVSRRKVEEAGLDAARRIVALEREIASLSAQQVQDGKVLAEMEANLTLFTEQYRAGGRSLLELVTQFESLVSMKRSHASLKYQISMARLEIALTRGVLVDGGRM
ncbi:TolC family protein [Pseudogemmobacter sonorensis]|uniref:TolC family protein n=1 Tax=Pseudogemmobacter sonorensis TaxID=2989681 RepID=UPI0036C785AD